MRALVAFLLAFASVWSAATTLPPPAMIGVWTTDESVFEGDTFWGGVVLYIDSQGAAGLVLAPLPVGRCGEALCNPKVGVPMRLVHTEGHRFLGQVLSKRAEGKPREIGIEFSETDGTLLISRGAEEKLTLRRRTLQIPERVQRELAAAQALVGVRD